MKTSHRIGTVFDVLKGACKGSRFKIDSDPMQDAFGRWYVTAKKIDGKKGHDPEIWHFDALSELTKEVKETQ